MTIKKLVLVVPYHDPEKIYFDLLIKSLPELMRIFNGVCISITPSTADRYPFIAETLQKIGCFVLVNKKGSVIADHYVNALGAYLKYINNGIVYFGFIDRILFALETRHKKSFIKDITKKYHSDVMIFSRSQKAWKTHPKDYYASEKIVEDIGYSFLGKRFDWAWCGALLSQRAVRIILSKKSRINDFSIEAEWILSCYQKGCSIESKKVDWLAWEDPFWAKHNGKKISSNLTTKQKIFRLTYNIHALQIIHKAFDV